MNITDLYKSSDKDVVAQNIHRDKGNVTLLQLKKCGILKEHQSVTNALLLLLEGSVRYEEADRTVSLDKQHDFVRIPAKVTHRLVAQRDARLLLIQ